MNLNVYIEKRIKELEEIIKQFESVPRTNLELVRARIDELRLISRWID